MSVDYDYDITLNAKRASIIYLNEVLQLYGELPFIKDRFVEI